MKLNVIFDFINFKPRKMLLSDILRIDFISSIEYLENPRISISLKTFPLPQSIKLTNSESFDSLSVEN